MHPRTWIAVLALGLMAAAPADASFHLIKVVEVFPGTASSPNAQFVELQMYAAGQTFLSGHALRIYNSAGVVVGTFTCTSNLSNGANQATMLFATPEASFASGVSADVTMTPVISAVGGKACWDAFDCVSWGNYSGSVTGVGTPAAPDGIPVDQSIRRRLDIAGSPTTLDAADDTNDSANDFVVGNASAQNNAGTTSVDDTRNVLAFTATPNPFHDELTVLLTLPRAGHGELRVYDLNGRMVRSLHRSELDAGTHRFVWDGRDDTGRPAAVGVYVIRFRSGTLTSSATVVRLQ